MNTRSHSQRLAVAGSAGLLATWLAGACAGPGSPGSSAPEPAAAAATLEPATCGAIQNLHKLGDVYLAGQPSAADFEQAKELGIRTVVNLRHDRELTDLDERAVVDGLGLAYVQLPWNGAAELTDEVFERSRELLRTAERPLLLHCGSANRVGAVWLPYRVLDGGLSLEEALAEAKAIGLKTPEYEAKAREYVARHGADR